MDDMKKRKFKWKTVIAAAFAVAGLVIMIMMYTRLQELTNQLVYLQDTTNIILSDVGGMQSNIEKTLKEEASMVESYTMDIVDMDFATKTYEVKVSVIPKEYSEKTKVSVYFGTTECPLKLEGYAYTGQVDLPLDKSFDGNVTFLLANGKKKSTEVLENYDGLDLGLNSVLSGKLDHEPACKDGTLSLKSDCSFSLDGGKQFQFEKLELVAALDEEEIWTQDLFENLAEDQENNETDSGNSVKGQRWEQMSSESREVEELLPVNGYSSEMQCHFSYDLMPSGDNEMQPQENEIPSQEEHLRIFLRAVSADGYRFEYDVFQADYRTLEKKLDPESYDWSSHSVAYDKKGNVLNLD